MPDLRSARGAPFGRPDNAAVTTLVVTIAAIVPALLAAVLVTSTVAWAQGVDSPLASGVAVPASIDGVETASRVGNAASTQPPPEPPPVEPQKTFVPSEFRYNECDWVGDELRRRNVAESWVQFMVGRARVESGCCPFVRGGDVVSANCELLYVGRRTHRSDTGLFQLNGVHWKTPLGFMCPEFTCDQDTLLNDIGMQFDAMLVLLQDCGAKPWDKPTFGCRPPGNIYNPGGPIE